MKSIVVLLVILDLIQAFSGRMTSMSSPPSVVVVVDSRIEGLLDQSVLLYQQASSTSTPSFRWLVDQLTSLIVHLGQRLHQQQQENKVDDLETELQAVEQQLKSIQELLESTAPLLSTSSSSSSLLLDWPWNNKNGVASLDDSTLSPSSSSSWSDIIQVGRQIEKATKQGVPPSELEALAESYWQPNASSQKKTSIPKKAVSSNALQEAQKKANSFAQQMEAFLLGDEQETIQNVKQVSAQEAGKSAAQKADNQATKDTENSFVQQMEDFLLSDDDAKEDALLPTTKTVGESKSRDELIDMANEIDNALIQGQDFERVEQMVNEYRQAMEKADDGMAQQKVDGRMDSTAGIVDKDKQPTITKSNSKQSAADRSGPKAEQSEVDSVVNRVKNVLLGKRSTTTTTSDEKVKTTAKVVDVEATPVKMDKVKSQPTTAAKVPEKESKKDVLKPKRPGFLQAFMPNKAKKTETKSAKRKEPVSKPVKPVSKPVKPVSKQPKPPETQPDKFEVHSPLFFANQVVNLSAKVDTEERRRTLKDELDKLNRMALGIQQAAKDGSQAVSKVARDGTQAVTKAAETVETGVKQTSEKVVQQSVAVGSKIGAAWCALTSTSAKIFDELSQIQAVMTAPADEVSTSQRKTQASKESGIESSDSVFFFASEVEPASYEANRDDDESSVVANFRKLKADMDRATEMARSIQSTTVRAAKTGTEIATKLVEAGSELAPIAGLAASKAWSAVKKLNKTPSSKANKGTAEARSDSFLNDIWFEADSSGEEGQLPRTPLSLNKHPGEDLEDLAQAWNRMNATTDSTGLGVDGTEAESATTEPASAAWQRIGRAWKDWNGQPTSGYSQSDKTTQEGGTVLTDAEKLAREWALMNGSADRTADLTIQEKSAPKQEPALGRQIYDELDAGLEQLSKGFALLDLPTATAEYVAEEVEAGIEQLERGLAALDDPLGPSTPESMTEIMKQQPGEGLSDQSWEHLAQEWKAMNSESPSSSQAVGPPASKTLSSVASKNDEILTSWEQKTTEIGSYLEQLANNLSSASFNPNVGNSSPTSHPKPEKSPIPPKLVEQNSFSENARQLDSYMEQLANQWARREAELNARMPTDIESLDSYIKSPNVPTSVGSADLHSTMSKARPWDSLAGEWATMNGSSNPQDMQPSKSHFESKNVGPPSATKRDQSWNSLAAEWAAMNGSSNPEGLPTKAASAPPAVDSRSNVDDRHRSSRLPSQWAPVNGSSKPTETRESGYVPEQPIGSRSSTGTESSWNGLAAEWAAMNGSSSPERQSSTASAQQTEETQPLMNMEQSWGGLASEWAAMNGSSNPTEQRAPEPVTAQKQSSKLETGILASEWATMNGSSNRAEPLSSEFSPDTRVVSFSSEPEMKPSRPDWETLAQEWADINRGHKDEW